MYMKYKKYSYEELKKLTTEIILTKCAVKPRALALGI